MYYSGLTRVIDSTVRDRLMAWPNTPPGLVPTPKQSWLRGRPDNAGQCYLKLPGSDRLRTMPDGLWLSFGGKAAEPFVDALAIEACSSLTNLQDKRSRFAPSTQSMMAVCSLPWLHAPALADNPAPRWQVTGVLRAAPVTPLVLPVRNIRVMYGLLPEQYQRFMHYQLPHAHEFFVPMGALTAENGDQAPAMQALIARSSISANFFSGDIEGIAAS